MTRLLALLLALAAPAAAQTVTLAGTVSGGGNPLPGATVLARPLADTTALAASAVAGRGGGYALAGLAPGDYVVTAAFVGYRPARRRLALDADARLDLSLDADEVALGEVVVRDDADGALGLARLRPVDVEGVAIYEAKKNEVVVVDDLTANLATNNSRQIYGRVAGLNIWESDGAGVQLGLGGRGLSPNRNANFNTRQNGYDIAADALGYPESYYAPPAQAVERIEVVRGAASLQYGTQFGGLLNFVFRDGPEGDPLAVRASQSVGSYGLRTTFASAGGDLGRGGAGARYYGFYQYRAADGWRPNASLDQHTAYGAVRFEPTARLSVRPEVTHMEYLSQQPGGLTDAQFAADPRQSNRDRNWFRVVWNLLALRADYEVSSATTLNTRFFGLVAGRDAVGNLGRIDRVDGGGPRDLLKDDFRNWGNETRIIHRYPLLAGPGVLLVGARYYQGFTHRRQGEGSAGDAPDFVYTTPDNLEGSDFDLPSRNASLFAEHVVNLTDRVSVTPGVRFEHIWTGADGYYRVLRRDLAGNVLSDERIEEGRSSARSFVFFGLGASVRGDGWELYGNVSQNYRAITFNDLRVQVGDLEVDPDLADERGYNADLGLRGALGRLFSYDVTLFHLVYDDRIGTVLRTVPNPVFNGLVDRTFRFRTNVADARITGLESYAELDLYKVLVGGDADTRVSVFSNVALLTAEYAEGEPGVGGNAVELVPEVNAKVGLTVRVGALDIAAQVGHVGRHFSDATNAVRVPSAIEGEIPAYTVADLSAAYTLGRVRVEAGANNLLDARYFTRRATGYPGPGIIPSEGRSLYLTATVDL